MPPWLTCSDPATRGPTTLKLSAGTFCTLRLYMPNKLLFPCNVCKSVFSPNKNAFRFCWYKCCSVYWCFHWPVVLSLTNHLCTMHYRARSTSPWNTWLVTAHPLLLRGVLFCCRRKTLYCQTQTSPVIEGRWAWNSQSCTRVCFQPNLWWVEWKNKGRLVRLYAPLLFFHLAAVPCFSAHIH